MEQFLKEAWFPITCIILAVYHIQPKYMIVNFSLFDYTLFLFKIVYGSFVVFSTLCLIRLTSILPQVLSNKNPLFDPNMNQVMQKAFPNPEDASSMKLYAFFSEYYLTSFPMACILMFIFTRVVLNFIGGDIATTKAVARAKIIWANTLICWAAIFTVISTISLLISASS